MQQIINFVLRNKTFLMFMLLFGLSIALTIQNHNYHRSKFLNSTNFISGGLFEIKFGITQYFGLKNDNELLLEENKNLRSQLLNQHQTEANSTIDSINISGNYVIYSAQVYKNSYALNNNYLTINKGSKDGINQDFGVFTSKGIIGIIDATTNGYSRVQSILNTKSRINAQIKNSSHIGSLRWNAKSPQIVQMVDVSKFAPVKNGDTIITGGQSSIFPKGILIGLVDKINLEPGGDTYSINVELFNDMTNIGHVYVVENKDSKEIKSLDINNE